MNEDILIKIKKLLSLAKKNSNENEAAAAAAKAQELLFRYNISDEDVDSVQIEKEEAYAREFYRKHMTSSNVNEWKINLAHKVAKHNLCDMVYHNGGKELAWIGKPSNILVAQYLFETLSDDLERIVAEKWAQITALRKLEKQHGVNLFKDGSELRFVKARVWKNSFYWGAVEVISKRLSEGLATLKTESKIMALVVIEDRRIREFKDTLYGRLGNHRANKSISSLSGYNSGKSTGESLQFKRGINGSGGNLGPNLLKG